MSEILKKLTIKGLGYTVAEIKKRLTAERERIAAERTKLEGKTVEVASIEGATVDLAKVAGRTSKAQPGQTDKGEYIKLIGEFVAIDCATGEMKTSGVCILPNFVTQPLAEALKQSESVEFAVMVTAKHSPKSVTEYEFGVRALIETKPTAGMAALLALSGMDKPAALAAPAQNPAPAPAPAEPPQADASPVPAKSKTK